MYDGVTKRTGTEIGTDKLKIIFLPVNSNRLSVCELVYLDLWPRQGALVREKLWALKARVETIPYEDRVENVEEA